jgi:hypothetical protein
MSINPYIKKVKYIYLEEGPVILTKRLFRYFFYVIRRRLQDSSQNELKWMQIKGAYTGKRAFIIGNGPSLNKIPLHLLKDEFTFCFNRFDLMLERLGWDPTFYAVIDDLVLDDTHHIINTMTDRVQYAFFPDIHPSASISKNYKSIIETKENVYWLHLSNIGFTDQLPECGINKTVANVAVQVLVHLGFSEIYFIGVDLDYKIPETVIAENRRELTGGEDDDPNHFDPRYFGKGNKYHYPRMDETIEKFEEASVFLQEKGVKGFNAGIGGKLESFERVSFKEQFSFSEIDELKLMIGHIKKDIISASLVDNFPNAKLVQEASDWDDACNEIICTYEVGYKLISQKIFNYIPYGPYQNQYLFIKRDCLSI